MSVNGCALKHEVDGAWSIVDVLTRQPIVINKVPQSGLEFYVAERVLNALKQDDIEPQAQMIMNEIVR